MATKLDGAAAFDQYDQNHDGSLSLGEVRYLFNDLGCGLSDREIKAAFLVIDQVRSSLKSPLHPFPFLFFHGHHRSWLENDRDRFL